MKLHLGKLSEGGKRVGNFFGHVTLSESDFLQNFFFNNSTLNRNSFLIQSTIPLVSSELSFCLVRKSQRSFYLITGLGPSEVLEATLSFQGSEILPAYSKSDIAFMIKLGIDFKIRNTLISMWSPTVSAPPYPPLYPRTTTWSTTSSRWD
jgi:hypothetical protein